MILEDQEQSCTAPSCRQVTAEEQAGRVAGGELSINSKGEALGTMGSGGYLVIHELFDPGEPLMRCG